jgi:hypothetical protein
MKRVLITAAVLLALGGTATALASRAAPITEKVLGAADISQRCTIHVTEAADAVVAEATVPPGASFGWHYHRADVAVVFKSCTVSLHDGADRKCSGQRYSAAQGFAERPHHVHLARNEGHEPAVVLVVYLGLKHGVNPDVPAARPGNCHFQPNRREVSTTRCTPGAAT